MRYLLDTQALLWYLLDDSRLSLAARETIADLESEIFVSPASWWEVAIKISIGKYSLPERLSVFINRQMELNDFQTLHIQPEHIEAVSSLPFHHKDPFDRLLVAQALSEDLTLISIDAEIAKYAVRSIW